MLELIKLDNVVKHVGVEHVSVAKSVLFIVRINDSGRT